MTQEDCASIDVIGEAHRPAAHHGPNAPVVWCPQSTGTVIEAVTFSPPLGEENMLPHVEAALSRAREVYEGRAADPRVNKVIYQT